MSRIQSAVSWSEGGWRSAAAASWSHVMKPSRTRSARSPAGHSSSRMRAPVRVLQLRQVREPERHLRLRFRGG
mgnify:CR=1 FL=1